MHFDDAIARRRFSENGAAAAVKQVAIARASEQHSTSTRDLEISRRYDKHASFFRLRGTKSSGPVSARGGVGFVHTCNEMLFGRFQPAEAKPDRRWSGTL